MFKLIKSYDSNLMSRATFVKNAVFYKDMLAFYDAFEKIESTPKENLPNYCFDKDDYLLDGVCLLIETYQSEFGFESLNLTNDYLKVIYYCIAGYSEDNVSVNRAIIEKEIEEYKSASEQMFNNLNVEFEEISSKMSESNKMVNSLTRSIKTNKKWSSFSHVLYVICFTLAFVLAMLPFTFFFLNKINLVIATIASAVILAFGLLLYFVFKFVCVSTKERASGAEYTLQMQNKMNAEFNRNYIKSRDKINRVSCEKYEYNHNFSNEISAYSTSLTFDEILKKSTREEFLSYNKLLDINNTFKKIEEEISDIVFKINQVSFDEFALRNITELYQDIKQEDYLYFSNSVRYNYLLKVINLSQQIYTFKLTDKDLSFGIDIEKMKYQKIAYMSSDGAPLRSGNLTLFKNTKIFKSTFNQSVENLTSIEEIRNLKNEYINHFYDYNALSKYNNLFIDKRLDSKSKMTDKMKNETKLVPTLEMLKFRVKESSIGFENIHSSAVKQIAENIVKFSKQKNPNKSFQFSNSAIYVDETLVDKCESFVEEANKIQYKIGDTTFTGYKFVV